MNVVPELVEGEENDHSSHRLFALRRGRRGERASPYALRQAQGPC